MYTKHFEQGWGGWTPLDRDLPGDETVLGDYLYQRQLDSLASMGPGFTGRLLPWHDDRARFSWGVQDEHELGRLKRAIDAGRPVPIGLISLEPDLFKHHQAVAIGYDHAGTEESVLVHLYDPNHPDTVTTLSADPPNNRFTGRTAEGGGTNGWRTYFVDEGYHPGAPRP